MTDLHVRREGRAGWITLDRPDALNALTWEMCLGVERALDDWREDEDVALVIVDAAEGRAFCAGGDIVAMHAAAGRGEWDYGARFWADEYRMNAKMARYPKPVVAFLHGFTMGGGVGVGCHASHRIVRDDSRVAMPECGIGLVPDVGGSRLLARAPGRLGEFLGTTGWRMGPGDAIHAGFADHYLPEGWDDLKAWLMEDGDVRRVAREGKRAPEPGLEAWQEEVDALFGGEGMHEIAEAVERADGPAAQAAREAFARCSPLSMACTVEIQRRLGEDPSIVSALGMEARFTFRALEQSDFVEGIRAQVIDKDRAPRWRHAGPRDVPEVDVSRMLQPLGDAAPNLEETP